jgi:hypothetical protein
MPKRSRKPPSDPFQAAHAIFEQIAGEKPVTDSSLDRLEPHFRDGIDQAKDPAAVALGRRGGLKGGKARSESMTPEERKESARKAAEARWGKK